MDNIKESVQEMDPEAGQAVEWNDEASEALPDIFGNRVILNHILEQLPNSELLELSLVNKLWKKEARLVMKKGGDVMALLEEYGIGSCGRLLEVFAANLETLNEALYSGMHILLHPLDDCKGTGASKLERVHESILAGMRGKLKRLSIQIDYHKVCWNNPQNCPFFLLLRLLLRYFARDLEHLTFESQNDMEPFVQQFLPHGPYPNLKVLKLKDTYWTSNQETFGGQIRMLLSRAPNLRVIHTYGNVSLRENLLEGREGVVHVHEADVDNAMEDISEIAIPALRLKKIRFIYNTEPKLELDSFNEKAQSLLRTCCTTKLEYLELDAVSAVLFMYYGIRLENVEMLEIGLDYVELEQFAPRIMSILSRFDFTYLFPKIEIVDIFTPERTLGELSRDTIDAIVEQASAVPMEPTLPRAGNINELCLYESVIRISAVQFFAHMFPAIQELYSDAQDGIFPVESAWELWPELKLIVVDDERYQRP